MGNKVLAIVGSYRKGGIVDSAVDAILEGAREKGADTQKIYLLDRHIEFCTNCRTCTQTEGPQRGLCPIEDDMPALLSEIDAADSLVLGTPVNFFNANALFRRFMERLAGYAYWPWGKPGPTGRVKIATKKAALVTSTAMPSLFIPFATGAPRALKMTAKVLGAKSIGNLWIGLSAIQPRQKLSSSTLNRARRIGAKLGVATE